MVSVMATATARSRQRDGSKVHDWSLKLNFAGAFDAKNEPGWLQLITIDTPYTASYSQWKELIAGVEGCQLTFHADKCRIAIKTVPGTDIKVLVFTGCGLATVGMAAFSVRHQYVANVLDLELRAARDRQFHFRTHVSRS